MKPETDTNPKPDGPEPGDPTIKTGRFQFQFLPTRKIRVGSGSSTNPTQPDPWTSLHRTMTKTYKKKEQTKA